MASKPKVALYWCSSCGGCEETVVDLEEKILDVVAAIDIIFWPCAMDFKYSDVEAMKDGEIAVSFINGAIRTEEQEHVAKLLRKKSQFVIAFGSCSCLGGIPALANLKSKAGIFERSYLQSPTVDNPQGTLPQTSSKLGGYELHLPNFYETVYRLDNVIDVDYFLPGCPPTSKVLADAVGVILSGKLPPKKSVLLPNRSLCDSCDRNKTKPENVSIEVLHRVVDIQWDPQKCFLAQGILCMGPATRDGCDFPCVKGNMPCTGCFGPVQPGDDQGAKIIAALGGVLEGDTDEAAAKHADNIPDPAGTFYRYSVAASMLGSERKTKE